MSCAIHKSCGWEDSGLGVLARVYELDGSLIQQADFGTITCKVFDKDDADDTGTSVTVTVGDAVFDALQSDAIRWHDSTGYNFDHIIPASVLSAGATTYRIEYRFNPTSGESFSMIIDHDAKNLRTS